MKKSRSDTVICQIINYKLPFSLCGLRLNNANFHMGFPEQYARFLVSGPFSHIH
jgi:hypothetical protein